MVRSIMERIVKSGSSVKRFVGNTTSAIRGDAIRNDLSQFTAVYDEVIKNLDQRIVELDQAASLLLEEGRRLKKRVIEESDCTDARIKNIESTIDSIKQAVDNARSGQIKQNSHQIVAFYLLAGMNALLIVLLIIGLVLMHTGNLMVG